MHPSDILSKWRHSSGAERANAQAFLIDVCRALDVDPPHPATSDPERDDYVFEKPVAIPHEGRKVTIGRIDLYKRGHFVLEAKQGSHEGSHRAGVADRNTPRWQIAMQDAFGQALKYARHVDDDAPFVVVTDVGYCFDLYSSFDGTRNYRPFPDAKSSRLFLSTLIDETANKSDAHTGEATERSGRTNERTNFISRASSDTYTTLRNLFLDPWSLDPARRAARVTRDVAAQVAEVARQLEAAGHDPERVAKFLMRCLFTMFAEDVRLLRERIFSDAFDRWLEHPERFPSEVEDLWTKMDQGGTLWGSGRIWRFNGGLFADPVALPLDRQQLRTLQRAAESDWAEVEPAIFGTLLERALDPNERHRLGAHYTPRAYVERLVRPTIEEPLRAEWETVRATVRVLLAAPDADANRKTMAEARAQVANFLERLTQVRILDPACGTGNFLYVSLDVLKRLENEALELYDQLGGAKLTHYGRLVSPQQFLGIEIKRWAKEIAELVLWIGYLQWQVRTKGFEHPDEPILRDYHNIECRDAILAYDDKVPLLDDAGEPVTRWDGATMKRHPVTGEEVPDETARVPVYRYVNPRKAEWPEAEFIVGNPPFIGDKMMRQALGTGYVDTLRSVYSTLGQNVDYVLYWWSEAAERIVRGAARRFGLIATNSLRQTFNRRVLSSYVDSGMASLAFAIPDHPWVDDADGADVRISMTVAEAGERNGVLQTIVQERATELVFVTRSGKILPDLTIGANVAGAKPLLANRGLSCVGVKLFGQGFVLTRDEAVDLGLGSDDSIDRIIRPYRIGKHLTQNEKDLFVIDALGYSASELQARHPRIYQWLLDRVKPERDTNARASYRDKWWLFGEPRKQFRPALEHLSRFIVTVETSKHRFFAFMQAGWIAEGSLVIVADDDAATLGVLSSRVHVAWALAAGGRLGVGNDPRYNKTRCFDPFPFPVAAPPMFARIATVAELLDAHRKTQQSGHPHLTITAMYNVLEKLRAGEPLTDKEKIIHDHGLVSVLKQLHDDLDAAVFDAYGWPHDLTDERILERLVALNAERAEEERRGIVRWLRPDFQNRGGATAVQASAELDAEPSADATLAGKQVRPWPKELPAQIAAVRDIVTANANESWTAERAARAFKGAKRSQVEAVLESLSALGLLVAFGDSPARLWAASR